MSASLLSSIPLAPRDPILGLNEAFSADTRANKVNLGVGVYYDDEGRLPLLQAVRKAEQQRVETASSRGYLPIEGIAAYDLSVQKLLFGSDSELINAGRLVTAQALGGTGALKIGADFLQRFGNSKRVLISDPSWENHRALFESAGFAVDAYPYYNESTRAINFSGLLNALNTASPSTPVVLHACCHNPTGVDLTVEQWQEVVTVIKQKQLVPFLDIAYQGFGDGLDQDAAAVRLFAQNNLPLFVASSFSKSLSLYGERVGALTVLASSKDEAVRVLSQLKRVIRTNYSNPPTHGASVVASVLSDTNLRLLWEQELTTMRERIKHMRAQLADGLKKRVPSRDFSFITQQRGMFSYSGLTASQVKRLQEEFAIYAVSTGRICVAALNSRNIDYVCDAIATVLS